MRRQRKGPSAAAVRLAAADRTTLDTNFESLIAEVLFREDGELKARFADHSLKPPFRLGYLASVMDASAAEAFVEGFVVWAGGYGSFSSRLQAHRTLKYGFAKFLAEPEEKTLSLPFLDTKLVLRFEQWLLRKFSDNRRQRGNYRRALEEIIGKLRLMPKWSDRLAAEIEFPAKRRDRKARKTVTNKVVSAAEYDALWRAASRKMRAIIALHERRKVALEAFNGRPISVDELSRNPVALAAYMARAWPDTVPPTFALVKDPPIGRAAGRKLWPKARRLLMPEVDELLPAILILTTVFALNPGVVQGLRYRTDYEFKDSLGRQRLFMFPKKLRSRGKRQRNSVVVTEDADNPGRILRYLEERTSFLRSRVGAPQASFLFLWLHRFGPASFAKNDFTFRQALKRFGERHKIPLLQLKKVRPSSLDRVHEITGGDLLKVRDIANHESIQTTFVDYETDAMARRDIEKLGEAMLQNDRFTTSGGVIKTFLTAPELDRGSATPGYACLDPLLSPIPGERDGVLCKAYGRCPICPLAALQPTPRAFAYLDALAVRIDEALTNDLVSGPEWLGRWAIVKKSLARQMRLYPDEVVRAAANETISPLPPLE